MRFAFYCPFVVSLSNHERATFLITCGSSPPFDRLRTGFDRLRTGFDRLRTSGVLNTLPFSHALSATSREPCAICSLCSGYRPPTISRGQAFAGMTTLPVTQGLAKLLLHYQYFVDIDRHCSYKSPIDLIEEKAAPVPRPRKPEFTPQKATLKQITPKE